MQVLFWCLLNAAHKDNLLHSQQHHSCQFVEEKTYHNKHRCIREFRVNRQLTHFEKGDISQSMIKSNCITDIVSFAWFSIGTLFINIVWLAFPNLKLLMKVRMVCPRTINFVTFGVTCLPTENVPRELTTCFREVLDDGGTIHAEPYCETAPSSPCWTKQHKVGGGVILPCNYIIRHLPSTYMTRSSVCWADCFLFIYKQII